MSEHTALPWRELAPGVITGATDPGWGAIAKVSQAEREPEARANADFIVRAVNNFYPLLEALEKAWEKADWSAVDGDTMSEVADVLERAKGARP